MEIERRIHSTFEVLDDEGGRPTIEGYAAKFNELSADLGGFRERIAPGAFARTLDEGADVRALVDHDPSRIIGRTTAGTLELIEDATGLMVQIDPADTSVGRDLVESIRRGDINQMSFGFTIASEGDSWGTDAEGQMIRTLTDVDLWDVSAVTFPAYPDTEIAVRSMQHWQEAHDDSTARAKVDLMERAG